MTEALVYYQQAIEADRMLRPEPGTEPKTKTPAKRDTAFAKKKPAPAMTRPLAKHVLSDRAECGICHKQVSVSAETSLLTDHVAHPSVRPKGAFALCDGSGQQPAGPVVHSAETDYRK